MAKATSWSSAQARTKIPDDLRAVMMEARGILGDVHDATKTLKGLLAEIGEARGALEKTMEDLGLRWKSALAQHLEGFDTGVRDAMMDIVKDRIAETGQQATEAVAKVVLRKAEEINEFIRSLPDVLEKMAQAFHTDSGGVFGTLVSMPQEIDTDGAWTLLAEEVAKERAELARNKLITSRQIARRRQGGR